MWGETGPLPVEVLVEVLHFHLNQKQLLLIGENVRLCVKRKHQWKSNYISFFVLSHRHNFIRLTSESDNYRCYIATHHKNAMKSFIFLLLSLPVLALSWAPSSHPSRRIAFTQRTILQVSNGADPSFTNTEESVDAPCWQDIWSYDCAMSTAYSAAFVPADWIKKLPCALGLAVRNILLTPLTTRE